jgi:hypothetical protein
MTRLTPKDSLSPNLRSLSLSLSLPSVFLHKYSILTGYRHLRTRNIKHAFRGLGQEASPVKQKCRRWVILHLQKSSFKSPALPKLAPPGGMQETLKKKNEKCGSARASLYAQFTQRGSVKGAADSSPNSANKFEKIGCGFLFAVWGPLSFAPVRARIGRIALNEAKRAEPGFKEPESRSLRAWT